MTLFSFNTLIPDKTGDDLVSVQNNIYSSFTPYAMGSIDLSSIVQQGGIISTDYIDVRSQVPLWLRDRNDNSSLDSKMVIFLQKYYDWLYSQNGSQYILDDRFEIIKDIDNCPDDLVQNFLDLYTPGLQSVAEFSFVTTQNIRNFLHSIKNRLYDIKGTSCSVAYFFNTLFGSSGVSIESDEVGTYNLIVYFQEGHEPSIEQFNEIVNFYTNLIHPIGIKLNISQAPTTDDWMVGQLGGGESGGDFPNDFSFQEILVHGDGAYDQTGTGEEISILGNYFPYTLNDISSIVATAGCSGSTAHDGITGGATGNTYTNMTTFAFPDWSSAVTIAGTSFGLINIYDFAFLSAASGNTYVNDTRKDNNACPAGGFS